MKNLSKKITLIVIMSTIFSLFMTSNVVYADEAAIQINPETSIFFVGDTFVVNLTVTDVVDLYMWEVRLYYRNSILDCLNIAKGPFLETGGSTYLAQQVNNTYNSTHGRAMFGCTLLGPVPGVNGSGTLAFVTFKATSIGETTLHLENTKLQDASPPPRNPIPHTAIDGYARVVGLGDFDIAVINVETSKTGCTPLPTVGKGRLEDVYVTVLNYGTSTAVFNVTAYADAVSIGERQVTLGPSAVTVVTLYWDTSGFPYDDYTMSAEAEVLPGETDTIDNVYVNGIVRVVIPGDIDGSGEIDIFDAIMLATAFGRRIGDPGWNPNADIIADGMVDIFDAIILATHFGESQ